MKFAARPQRPEDVATLKQYALAAFEPHENFLKSSNPRLRGMVEGLADLI